MFLKKLFLFYRADLSVQYFSSRNIFVFLAFKFGLEVKNWIFIARQTVIFLMPRFVLRVFTDQQTCLCWTEFRATLSTNNAYSMHQQLLFFFFPKFLRVWIIVRCNNETLSCLKVKQLTQKMQNLWTIIDICFGLRRSYEQNDTIDNAACILTVLRLLIIIDFRC